MNTIIEFRRAKELQRPTNFGADSILLLEDTPERQVLLSRNIYEEEDEEANHWTDFYYEIYEGEERNILDEEVRDQNYYCAGIVTDVNACGEKPKFKGVQND